MEFAFKQYLDYNQDYKGKPVYNLPYWQQGVVKGITKEVNIALNKNDLATYILLHLIQYSPQQDAPATFFDSRYPSKPFFTFKELHDTGGIYPFPYISKGNSLKVVCTNAKSEFALLIQIVTQEKI